MDKVAPKNGSAFLGTQATGQPLGAVQVFVAGTNRNTLTNTEGQFLLTGVPAGEQRVQAELIGFGGGSTTVTVPAGGSVTADFQLTTSAVALEGLVVTATGQQRRREVGSTVASIEVEEVELAAVSTMSDLLQGRAAGVTVMQSAGTSGTGSRVRIRGQTSISLSNEPLLVVDGVQVDNGAESFAFGLGGQSISRLDDINPESIESIEILKGPAAAALYGTAAANGVIQITTKRGRAGDARWNVWTEYGQLKDVTDYPANWQGVGTNADGALVVCRVYQAAAGSCTPTEVRSWNPLEEVPPFRTGINRTVGMSVFVVSAAWGHFLIYAFIGLVLFALLSDLPAGVVLVIGAILLISVFFVTSSDSGSLVMSMIAAFVVPVMTLWCSVMP